VDLVEQGGEPLDLVEDSDLVPRSDLLGELGRTPAESEKDVAVEEVEDLVLRQRVANEGGLPSLARPKRKRGFRAARRGMSRTRGW
jgi:hypothetical protein